MYRFLYGNYSERIFPHFCEHFQKLYQDSLENYRNTHPMDSSYLPELEKLEELFRYVEYYFASLCSLGFTDKDNFSNILEQMNHLRLLRIMEMPYRKQYNGLTYRMVVTMNPDAGCYKELTDQESLQLSTFHELGHVLLSSNDPDFDYLSTTLAKSSSKDPDAIQKGFQLLSEVVAENVGEDVLCRKRGVRREKDTFYLDSTICPNRSFTSNFYIYQEFQDLAYRFSCSLDFLKCSSRESRNTVLKRLSKAMFSRKFCCDLYQEIYANPSKGEDILTMLSCMGKIYDAKHATFSKDKKEKIDASRYFQCFYKVSQPYLRDTEEKKYSF